MEILKKIDDLLIGWGISPSRADMFDQFIAFALILAVAFLADALCRKILLKVVAQLVNCLLYTSDAADDLLCVDLGGRRIIKKKNKNEILRR